MRFPRAPLLTASALLVAACVPFAGSAANEGDATAPVLARFVIQNLDGTAAGGAELDLVVIDESLPQSSNGTVTEVYLQAFRAKADGTLTIHLVPPPAVVAYAAKQGQPDVQFTVTALSGGQFPLAERPLAIGVFSRPLVMGAWQGDPPLLLVQGGYVVVASPSPAN
jgi:hypothetical protein